MPLAAVVCNGYIIKLFEYGPPYPYGIEHLCRCSEYGELYGRVKFCRCNEADPPYRNSLGFSGSAHQLRGRGHGQGCTTPNGALLLMHRVNAQYDMPPNTPFLGPTANEADLGYPLTYNI